ncbi:T9SS type A sorting domain-containing protein [Flavobacterium sp.]|uniref:T9SS type A sorting domain-containing protein n=1 Tax=Flavobacterium sp. TaxID=239 RepID=UPI00260F1997|nr:T9SS type A sorting domain-containing protein [Flavobacterium sp.]
MKKITFKILLVFALLLSAYANSQCLVATNGQWPTDPVPAATCDGLTATIATAFGYASEYSAVELVAGETYTFKSSIATDYITISTDDGATAATFGATPLMWVSDFTGVARFYTHVSDACGGNTNERTRSFICGVPPCIAPMVTFTKTFDCGNSNFGIDANITSIGDAASVTVTDDQGSPSQTVSSTGLVSFGPYAFGTSVVFTATNDQNSICNLVSEAQVVNACPPTNDTCDTAIVLNCGDVLTNQTTEGATGGSATSCVGTIGDDIWYTFTGDGKIYTLTATALGTSDGAQVEVYASTDGSCAGFTPGNCFASNGTGDAVVSVAFASTDGTVYYAHIGNWINGDPAITFDLALTCQTPSTPPANDDCTGAYAVTVNSDLTCTSVTAGDLTGATGSTLVDGVCFGTADDDVWFSFTATEVVHSISLNDVTGNTDLYHSLWTGDCANLTLVPNSCSDANSSIPTGLTVGQTYYLRVYSYTDLPLQTSTFNVCIGTLPPTPANDECDGAVALTCGDTLSGQTTLSATGGTATSCIGTIGNDIWYSIPGNGQLITLTAVASSEFPQIQVYESTDGTCAGFTPGTCFASAGTGETTVNVTFPSTIGTTYYVQIGNYINGNPGVVFDLSATCADAPLPPANDDCGSAEALTLNTEVTGTTAGATTTALGITPSCQVNRANDVWYSIQVPASGVLTVTTNPAPGTAMTDSVLSVFTGSCGSFTEVGCDDDNAADNFSTVEMTGLTAGDTVLIGVWRYSLGTGVDGEFIVKAFDPTLATNTFDNAAFDYYPSPVKDVLTLSYNKNITSVAVFNLLGQEVMTKSTSANLSQIDMSNLAKGTYLVKVTADNQLKTIKVIKE